MTLEPKNSVQKAHEPSDFSPAHDRAAGSGSAPKPDAPDRSDAEAGRAAAMEGSRRVDERIRSVGGWRGEILSRVRSLIYEADPDMLEECKWAKPSNPLGVPVWSHAGTVCTGEVYQQAVKLTFARGASLADPAKLFNSSLDGNTRRAIDIREGGVLDEEAFKTLIQAAVAENLRSGTAGSQGRTGTGTRTRPARRR